MTIVIERADGGVSIMVVVNKEADGEAVNLEIERWKELHPGEYVSHLEVAESAIPSDRTFRNAWKAGAGTVGVDMDKAVEIHKSKLRQLRAPKLAALDTEYMKAMEVGDTEKMQTVAAQKQALRDVTKAGELTAAKTPDELKAVMPEVLK